MKRIPLLFLTLLLLLGVSQCRSYEKGLDEAEAQPQQVSNLQLYTYQQPLMGTRFHMALYVDEGERGKNQADFAAKAAFQRAADVNSACSDYDVTSELMQLNDAPTHQPIPISALLCDVLDAALGLAKKTNGAYDPTLGHHSYNWRMARKKGVLPSDQKRATAKAASGWKNLDLDTKNRTVTKKIDHMRLDLGGIAKGYAAEEMLGILKKHHITRVSVTAGGEVRLGERPPDQDGWKITLKTLDTNHRLSPQTMMLSNCAISTSGDLHQSITINGQRYSHIVNPGTGLGLTTRVSATIIANNATLSDALATAYCVQPDLHYPNIKSLVIRGNNQGGYESIVSKNWKMGLPQSSD